MHQKYFPIAMEEWLVYVSVKVDATIIWEGIITGFTEKEDAQKWQADLMENASDEIYSSLILTDIAPPPAEISAYLTEEIQRYKTGQEE